MEAVVGLGLQFIFAVALAIPMQQPMQQEGSNEFSLESQSMNSEFLMTQDAVRYEAQEQALEQKRKKNSVFPDAFGKHGSVDIELQDLNSAIYLEDQKKKDRQQFYSSQNKGSNSNLLDEKESDLPSLLKDFANESGLKEKVKDTLKSIKNMAGDLTGSDEISTENNRRETDRIIEQNRYRQRQEQDQPKAFVQKGISHKDSNKKYSSSVMEEFLSKILTFFLYAVLGIVLIKLLLMFVAWQRKLHKL